MAQNNSTKQIDEEMVCADSLVHCLKYEYGYRKVTVEKEEDDPPDLWLTIEDEIYAGEVTSIVTRQEYRAHCKKLEDTIRNSLQYGDSIIGTYALLIMGCPNIPKSSTSDWQDLVRQAISFINTTRNLKSTDKVRLLEDSKGYLDIEKISGQGAIVGAIGPIELKWQDEIEDTLQKLIEKSIKDKRQKLERKGIPAFCSRIILLLYDAYGFCDIGDVKNALQSVPDHDWFHSIFWVSSFMDRRNELSPANPDNPGKVGKFIYSRGFNCLKNKEYRC